MSAPAGDLVAHRADGLVDPGDFLRALGHGDAGLEALGAVGAARDDRPGRDQQARAGDDALVDRLLEADVGEAGAFGAEVALGGEAGIERPLGLDDRAGGAQRERLVQHLIVPQGLVVGVEEEVRMALDHAGHQGRAGQVDDPGAGGRGEVGPGRGDPVAVDQHRPAFVRARIDAVEHPRGAEEDRFRCSGNGTYGCDQRCSEQPKVSNVYSPTCARALRVRAGEVRERGKS